MTLRRAHGLRGCAETRPAAGRHNRDKTRAGRRIPVNARMAFREPGP